LLARTALTTNDEAKDLERSARSSGERAQHYPLISLVILPAAHAECVEA
jgi:hypothetical protein